MRLFAFSAHVACFTTLPVNFFSESEVLFVVGTSVVNATPLASGRCTPRRPQTVGVINTQASTPLFLFPTSEFPTLPF